MCKECENGHEHEVVAEEKAVETKVCKTCGVEKPVGEFLKDKNICRVCNYLEKNKELIVRENWSIYEYKLILHLIFNKKIEIINELVEVLNKELHEIALVVHDLEIRSGNCKIETNCHFCNEKIQMSLSRYFQCKKHFCNRRCQSKWQSTITGENNPKFLSKKIKCDWCEKDFYRKQFRLKKQDNHFCSKECRREWFSKEWSQREEWKKECAERATKMLADGIMTKTETNIQILINNILNKLGIEYENEYNCRYVAIDNALFINNKMLFVECMGTFWHCDNREYPTINYVIQKDRIRLDKIKHTYIRDNYNVEILYLWEKDIIENEHLCELLIKYYIKCNGVLNNYHSMNYSIDENDKLIENKDIIIPYMDWNSDDIKNIVDITVKEKMSMKQEDKWIKYTCEYCGKECESLICNYNEECHHFCSTECSGLFRKNRILVNCNNCGKELKVTQYKFNNHKYHFCNEECKVEYQKNVGFKTNGGIVEFKCEYCHEKGVQKTSDYNKSKHHYCSKECGYKAKTIRKNGEKKQVFFYCENCGEYTSKPTGDYNKAKHHYCCHGCSVEGRKKLKSINNQECVNL